MYLRNGSCFRRFVFFLVIDNTCLKADGLGLQTVVYVKKMLGDDKNFRRAPAIKSVKRFASFANLLRQVFFTSAEFFCTADGALR